MRRALALALGLMMLALSPAHAETGAPLRPKPRPDAVILGSESAQVRPKPRPNGLAASKAAPETVPETVPAAGVSLRPKPRPTGLGQRAAAQEEASEPAPALEATKQKPRKGSVCGSRAIRGTEIGRVKAKVKGCGMEAGVKVTEISGVTLAPAATINCTTAEALETWIDKVMKPAFGARKVVQLQVAASYACRPRNNVKGARVSEHGRGNAIDIAAFIMADGTSWSILHNYNKTIRKAHRGACGIFGTTLGPGSDGYHENHLHFDVARYRNPYCH